MNHTEMNTLKNVKPFDVRQEFDQYSRGITVIDNILYIKFHSILGYMFSHADILESCRKISTQCTKYIVSSIKKYEEEESILQLQVYQSVVASNYFQQMHQNLLRAIDITVFDTPYIHYQYQNYSEIDWKKVCLFEDQFAKYLGNELCSSYEESL